MLVWDFALLFVWLDEHTGVADEMRVALGKNELHGFWIVECDETKHPLLLIRDPHILNWPKITST